MTLVSHHMPIMDDPVGGLVVETKAYGIHHSLSDPTWFKTHFKALSDLYDAPRGVCPGSNNCGGLIYCLKPRFGSI